MSLQSDTLYTFQLKCITNNTNNNHENIASIQVTTNGGPRPGSFQIFPHIGTEMNTTFEFKASNWEDKDIPITYVYGFRDINDTSSDDFNSFSSIEFVATSDRISETKTNTILPVGTLKGVVRIYDIYDAFTMAYDDVIVNPIPAKNGEERMNSISNFIENLVLTSGSLTSNSGNAADNADGAAKIKEVKKLISSIAASLNMGNEYSSYTSASSSSTATTITTTTTTTNSDGTSSIILKRCPNDCKKDDEIRGSCHAVKITDGSQYKDENGHDITICNILQVDCEMICKCYNDYKGRSCSLSTQEFNQKVRIRGLLLETLFNTSSYEKPNEAVVGSRLNNLISLSSAPDELNLKSINVIEKMSLQSMSDTKENNLDRSNVNMAVTAFTSLLEYQSIILSASGTSSTTNNRKLSSNGNSVVTVNDLYSMMNQVSTYYANQLVPGEIGQNFQSKHYSMEIKSPSQSDNNNDDNNNDDFNIVLSSLVPGNDVKVSLNDNPESTLRMSITEIASYLYENEVDNNNNNLWSVSSSISSSYSDRYVSNAVQTILYDEDGINGLKNDYCGPSKYFSDGRKVLIKIPRTIRTDGFDKKDLVVEYKTFKCPPPPTTLTSTSTESNSNNATMK